MAGRRSRRFALGGIALALAGAAPPDRDRATVERIGALMEASIARAQAGDFAAMAALIDEAETLLVANPAAFDKAQHVFVRFDVALAHGEAVYAGRLGDPCPHFARARAAALEARDMAADDGAPERHEAAAGLLAAVERAAGRSACAVPSPDPAPAPDPAFAGHYYLSGVMETGSELLLRPDGTFDWYLSYGAVDQVAAGTWGRDGAAIVLVADRPARDKPLFAFRAAEPWSEAAEDELLRRRHDEADEKARARCPFLAGAVVAAASPAPPPGDEPSPEALRADAAAALQRALAARAQAETLVRAELASPPREGSVPPRPTAAEALGRWENARWEAIDAARRADLPDPDLADPVLPVACALAKRAPAATIPPAQWMGGLGVRIADEASGQGARDVKVTLRFADGTRTTIPTTGRGFALLPGKPASPVVGVDLAADYAPGRDQSLAIAPTKAGIVHIMIDAAQIVPPPFATMRLRIDGRALVPAAAGRGRYERPD